MKAVKVVVIIAIALAAVAGYRWFYSEQGEQGPFRMYGNVDIREVELAFRQPGRLAMTKFDEGAAVKAGALMAELDAQPYRESLAVAEAEVERARAELEKLRRGNRPQEVAQALEAVRRAEAVYQNAESDFQRQSGLAASGSASERVADAARSLRDQAQAALASAKQALELKKEGFRREDIAAAAARVRGAQALVTQAKTAVSDTRLIAPADGIVISRVREAGSMVNASTPVYVLSLRDPVYVRAYVSEPNLGRVVPGTKVSVRTDSSDKVYQGQIGFVSPRAEFTPKSVETTDLRTDLVYRLRIVVTNADDGLRQGMPVTIQLAADAAARSGAGGARLCEAGA